jgi:ketosteroid isomerase-like protein
MEIAIMVSSLGTDTPRPGREGALSAVRRYYRLVDAGDVPGLIDLFAPEASYHRPGYPRLVGRGELERFYREERVIKEGSHTLTMLVAADSDVAVHGVFRGLLRDGRRVEARFADFFTLGSDGRFVHRDTFFFAPMV